MQIFFQNLLFIIKYFIHKYDHKQYHCSDNFYKYASSYYYFIGGFFKSYYPQSSDYIPPSYDGLKVFSPFNAVLVIIS